MAGKHIEKDVRVVSIAGNVIGRECCRKVLRSETGDCKD